METLHIYNVFGDIESITSNKKSIGLSAIVSTGGYSNHSKTERQEHDYYATNPLAVDMLFELEDFSDKPIWECACGGGHLSKAMLAKGAEVYSSDLHDRGFGEVKDFLSNNVTSWHGHIITNPPYTFLYEFMNKALSITETGNKVAFFLPVRCLEGRKRGKFFLQHPPKTLYVSSGRLGCVKNGDFLSKPSSAVCYAWYIWHKGFNGVTELKWFNH